MEPTAQRFIDSQGCDVWLTDERLRHMLRRHPEMAYQLRHIEETLERPDAIRESKSDQSVILYYRLYDDRQGRKRHLCLVVKRDEGRSFILTGYLTRRISGDRQ